MELRNTKKIGSISLFLALALILSYLESFIPVLIPVPGIKIGLPNLVIIMVLYLYDFKTGALINVMRVLIAGFMFGNAFSIIYGLSGAILSLVVMGLGIR